MRVTGIGKQLVANILANEERVAELSEEVSTGLKVRTPGDSTQSGTVAQYRSALERYSGFRDRIKTVDSFLTFQEGILSQANDLLIRAKEIAAQGANETNGPSERDQLAAEMFQIRDQLVSLANSTYQGRYIFGGDDDDDPPYDAATYTNPSTGSASQRYVFDAEAGTSGVKTVAITDDLSMSISTPANTLFDNAIQGLERLARALDGYDTQPTSGAPDGTGNAYTFPTDFATQSQAIRNAMDQLDTARKTDIIPGRTTIGGKLKRLETAESLINVLEFNSKEVLGRLQDADVAESASALLTAQQALQASFTVSARVLNITILDYI